MAQWLPSQTGAMYELHAPRWQLETDVSEMTLDVLAAGTYLPQFSKKEHADDYAYRRMMSVPLDMCRDGIRIRMDNLWRTPPRREVKGRYAELIGRLIADCDAGGTPIDAFMNRAAWNHYATGVDLVTQMSRAPDGVEIATRADEQTHNIRPYFLQFTPLERVEWAVNGSRNFLWSRYALGETPRPDERDGARGERTFLTVAPGRWRLWAERRRVDEKGEEVIEVILVGEGENALTCAPVAKLYVAESQKIGQGGVPLGLLTRAAVVAKVAMNAKSQADADLIAAVTRWVLSGVQSDDLPDSYGPGTLFKVAHPEAKLQVVQGDVGHITEKREWLLLYLGEILRLLKFRGGMAEIQANSGSGLKLAIERTDLDNELRATATQLERTELELMRQAVVMATGTDIRPEDAAEELGYQAHYNRDFVLEPLGEMLDNVKTFAADCGFVPDEVPGILKEMLRQVGNMLARDGTPAHEAIADEIDKANFSGGDGEETTTSE